MKRETIEERFGPEWVDFMAPFLQGPEFKELVGKLKAAKGTGKKIFPDEKLLFQAFKATPFSKVRVVLLGQDPYPIEGYANGLAFSHSMEKKHAASMTKMIDAIEKDCYSGLNLNKDDFDTTLQSWADQGVLLLNTALTVEEKVPGSHAEIWDPFIKYVIKTLNQTRKNLIFLAWGKPASVLTEGLHFVNHFIFTCEHPSFAAQNKRDWECHHFSQTNAVITGNQLGEKIKW